MDRWVYGYGGMEGIGGVSYVTLTPPLLLFFSLKFFVGQTMRCGHEKTALSVDQCRYLQRGIAVSNVAGLVVLLASAQRHL